MYYAINWPFMSIRHFLLQNPGGFQWSELAWGNLEPSYACMNFFPPINSISWWQAAFEWGSSVLSLDFHYTSRVCTTESNNHQRLLQECPPLSVWWLSVQEAGVVVNRQLAPLSRQCSSTFLALDSDFFGEKPDSCGSPGSLVSWYDSLRPLAVPQTQKTIERKAISDQRGHYDCNDSWAKHHFERDFLGMFPTMPALLWEVCGVPRRVLRGW